MFELPNLMHTKKINVLIFPSGAENAIEVYRAIRHSIHINAFGATSRDDISQLIYGSQILSLPEMDCPEFITELNQLIYDHEIDIVFPTHDSAALHLATHADRISAKVVNSDLYTNKICRHKRLTYDLFRDEAFCPTVFGHKISPSYYPIFAKPDVGQGGKGARIIQDSAEYKRLEEDSGLVFLEYLPGREFTVDCFTDRTGALLFAGTRERVEVRMGISFRSQEVETTPEIRDIAEQINAALTLRGLWFFQLKESREGKLKLLEVSTRAAGTGGFFRHKGINLPLLTIFDLLERPLEIRANAYEVELFRTTSNCYLYAFEYQRVYVDFDDTLVVNGKINSELIRFLYEAVSSGKRLILITKHEKKPEDTLRSYKVCSDLFDEIIHLDAEESKVDHIDPEGAIFIDNWYKERKEVSDAYDMPVFDVDAVESLIHSL